MLIKYLTFNFFLKHISPKQDTSGYVERIFATYFILLLCGFLFFAVINGHMQLPGAISTRLLSARAGELCPAHITPYRGDRLFHYVKYNGNSTTSMCLRVQLCLF